MPKPLTPHLHVDKKTGQLKIETLGNEPVQLTRVVGQQPKKKKKK